MTPPRSITLQRCLWLGNVPRGVEDAAPPYKRKLRFFDTLTAAAQKPVLQRLFVSAAFYKRLKNLSAVLIHAERKFGVPLHSPDEPFIRQAYGLRQSILRDGHSRQPRRKRSHLTVKNKTEKSCATSLSVVLLIPQRAADCKPLHRRVAALEALIRRQGRIFVVQLPQQHGTAHHADEHIAVIHHRHKVLFDGCL